MTIELRTQSKAHPRADRAHDLYETTPVAVHALLKVERIPRLVWEPCAGGGAITRVLEAAGHDVISTDITTGTNFLSCWTPKADAIVTNPPFVLASEFAAHAVKLCPYVAMLLRLAFFETGDPRRAAGRARIFCLDERPPARMHVFINRLPFMHRHNWLGNRAKSAIAYAWFIWDRSHRGPTTIDRISWSEEELLL